MNLWLNLCTSVKIVFLYIIHCTFLEEVEGLYCIPQAGVCSHQRNILLYDAVPLEVTLL